MNSDDFDNDVVHVFKTDDNDDVDDVNLNNSEKYYDNIIFFTFVSTI